MLNGKARKNKIRASKLLRQITIRAADAFIQGESRTRPPLQRGRLLVFSSFCRLRAMDTPASGSSVLAWLSLIGGDVRPCAAQFYYVTSGRRRTDVCRVDMGA